MGLWKNFDELEENVNIEELNLLIDNKHQEEFKQFQRAASLKGIEVKDPNEETAQERFERVQNEAVAEARGVDPIMIELDGMFGTGD